jgi:hypothetical protein
MVFANQTSKAEETMKYLLIALVAAFVVTGCKTHDAGAEDGKYTEASNDRHSLNRVSNNLRGSAPSFGQ